MCQTRAVCQSAGGGVFTKSTFTQQKGDLQFKSCRGLDGGGMLVVGNVVQQGGNLSFHACKAFRSGGGISTNGSFTQEEDSVTKFRLCNAGRSGGGMDVLQNITLAGSTQFQTCTVEPGQGITTLSSGVRSDQVKQDAINSSPYVNSRIEQDKFETTCSYSVSLRSSISLPLTQRPQKLECLLERCSQCVDHAKPAYTPSCPIGRFAWGGWGVLPT